LLAKTVISGNTTGVAVVGTVISYGDNYILDDMTPLSGSFTPVLGIDRADALLNALPVADDRC
jgi:hypothetical protein